MQAVSLFYGCFEDGASAFRSGSVTVGSRGVISLADWFKCLPVSIYILPHCFATSGLRCLRYGFDLGRGSRKSHFMTQILDLSRVDGSGALPSHLHLTIWSAYSVLDSFHVECCILGFRSRRCSHAKRHFDFECATGVEASIMQGKPLESLL